MAAMNLANDHAVGSAVDPYGVEKNDMLNASRQELLVNGAVGLGETSTSSWTSDLINGDAESVMSTNAVSYNDDNMYATSVSNMRPVPKTKLAKVLFGKNSIHEILGGGNFANLLLWRSLLLSGFAVLFATSAWATFCFSRYSLISIVADIILILLTNATHFIDYCPPILDRLELKEEEVKRIATSFRIISNDFFAFVHRSAVGGNIMLFIKCMICLYFGAKIGAYFNFFTLLYVILLLCFTAPKAYEIYETDVDRVTEIALENSRKYYGIADKAVLSKLPKVGMKTKSQ